MKTRLFSLLLMLLISALLFGACVKQTPVASPTNTPADQGIGLPNPASVNCEQKGGKLDIRTAADGSQSGVCVFPDGSECDEWQFYRGECSPKAQEVLQPAPGMANPASVNCEAKGGKVEMRTDANGGQYGMCVFPDGSECDEWQFFRGECSPKTGVPDDVIPPAPGNSQDTPDALNQVANVAKGMLAEQLKIDPSGIVLAGMEEKTWSDTCLGLGRSDESCAQVETPGYLITLTVDSTRYTFHSDLAGTNVRTEP